MATVDADFTPTPYDYEQAIRAFMWADRNYRFSIIFFSFLFLFMFLIMPPFSTARCRSQTATQV